jgi:phosphatidylglycerol:prolipoprotein diacylglycerol transferase
MYPKLFTIGPFTVHSFGLMMGVAFIVGSICLSKELKRKGYNPNLGNTITVLAIFFGLAGSKLLFLIEEWPEFLEDPLRMTFSPAGLTWYGGFFLATLVIWRYTRRQGIPFLKVCDATAPALAIGYGIARIGCHLSGDGDYGMPTTLPWGTVYSKGIYPPSKAFQIFPEIVQQYGINGRVPDTISVHPTPIYEFILGVLLFLLLWKLRTRIPGDGRIFMIYLIGSGAARFCVEFIRLNPRITLGLSEAQLISLVLVILGTVGWKILSDRSRQEGETSRHA